MTEWRAISARIESLLGAGTFFLRTNDNDEYGGSSLLIDSSAEVLSAVKRFRDSYTADLPEAGRNCLGLYLDSSLKRFAGSDERPFGNASGFSGVTAVLTSLATFKGEFEYVIADTAAVARSLVVRGFMHLQRSIVADDLIRDRWNKAFAEGEVACETLGACQLLAHGVWAFKTSAAGERTDLVLGEPLASIDEVRRASQGLVLTEWKCVRDERKVDEQSEQAFRQAKCYAGGILAGFEVASPRYLVLVSRDSVDVPSPRQHGNTRYEFWNIAVAPSTPSKRTRAPSEQTEST